LQALNEPLLASTLNENVLKEFDDMFIYLKEIKNNVVTSFHSVILNINGATLSFLSQNKFEESIMELGKLKIFVKYFKDLPINLVDNEIGDNYHNFRDKVANALINLVDDSIDVLQNLIGGNLFKDIMKYTSLSNNIELISFTMTLRDLNELFDTDELNKKFSSLKCLVEKYLKYLLDFVKSSSAEREKQIYQKKIDFFITKQLSI
jgi:hypothetical protein